MRKKIPTFSFLFSLSPYCIVHIISARSICLRIRSAVFFLHVNNFLANIITFNLWIGHLTRRGYDYRFLSDSYLLHSIFHINRLYWKSIWSHLEITLLKDHFAEDCCLVFLNLRLRKSRNQTRLAVNERRERDPLSLRGRGGNLNRRNVDEPRWLVHKGNASFGSRVICERAHRQHAAWRPQKIAQLVAPVNRRW